MLLQLELWYLNICLFRVILVFQFLFVITEWIIFILHPAGPEDSFAASAPLLLSLDWQRTKSSDFFSCAVSTRAQAKGWISLHQTSWQLQPRWIKSVRTFSGFWRALWVQLHHAPPGLKLWSLKARFAPMLLHLISVEAQLIHLTGPELLCTGLHLVWVKLIHEFNNFTTECPGTKSSQALSTSSLRQWFWGTKCLAP